MQRLHRTAPKLCLTLHWISVLLAVLSFSCRNKVKILSAGFYLIQHSIAWNLWTKKTEWFPPRSQHSHGVQLGALRTIGRYRWDLWRGTVIRQVIQQRPKWRKCSDFKYCINWLKKVLLKSFLFNVLKWRYQSGETWLPPWDLMGGPAAILGTSKQTWHKTSHCCLKTSVHPNLQSPPLSYNLHVTDGYEASRRLNYSTASSPRPLSFIYHPWFRQCYWDTGSHCEERQDKWLKLRFQSLLPELEGVASRRYIFKWFPPHAKYD